MPNTSDNLGPLAAEKQAEAKKMPQPIVPPNIKQIQETAAQMAALTPKEEVPQEQIESGFRMNIAGTNRDPKAVVDATPDLNSLDPYLQAQQQLQDEIAAEEASVEKVLADANVNQMKMSGKPISELIEDDAYNLDVPIYAGAAFNPNLLKIDLKDPNMIARWGNRNNIRQSMLVAQGFKFVQVDDVSNMDTLSMFLDSQGHFVFADLVAMKIPKNVYYAGLRRAYMKSLHATNDKKARQGGAAFAAQALNRELTGAERSYMSVHKEQTHKDVYSPIVGV